MQPIFGGVIPPKIRLFPRVTRCQAPCDTIGSKIIMNNSSCFFIIIIVLVIHLFEFTQKENVSNYFAYVSEVSPNT